jgi:hypothetical protein
LPGSFRRFRHSTIIGVASYYYEYGCEPT